MAQMTGQISKLLADKYCGFITVDGSKQDYFFHVSGMNPQSLPYTQLREGMTVTFEPTSSLKGLRAENVAVTE